MNTRRTTSEICQNKGDWIALREVFIRSFVKYPVYQYLVRDEHKRVEFLRRYLTAHYNIHVKSGRSSLICIRAQKKYFQRTNAPQETLKDQDAVKCFEDKIVGGVLFVKPARSGIGWDREEDRIYEEAYAEVKLCDVDPEAFEKLQRYEAWEAKNIYDSVVGLKIPLWLGMFCAIDPDYSENGYGIEIYSNCIKIITDLEAKRQTRTTKSRIAPEKNDNSQSLVSRIAGLLGFSSKPIDEEEDCHERTSRLLREPPVRFIHAMSLLSHHAHICSVPPHIKSADHRPSLNSKCVIEKKSREIPVLMALSHSPRAVQFHLMNGFDCVKSVPFFESDFDESPFAVHVLMSDVFGAQRLNEISLKLGNLKKMQSDGKGMC